MERVLICSTQSALTILYVEDLLEAPMDLYFSPTLDFTTWWPDHDPSSLKGIKLTEEGTDKPTTNCLDYAHKHRKLNEQWFTWFGDEASKRNIITLYAFAKIWNSIYPSFKISGVVEVLENSDEVFKREGESLDVTIEYINRFFMPSEKFSAEEMMRDLLDMLENDFSELYTEYQFYLINVTDKPDNSIFRDDVQWSNRIITQHHLSKPYTELIDRYDCVYLDGHLLQPNEHYGLINNPAIRHCWSVLVYPR